MTSASDTSTELKAVNQILASTGQAPVTSLETQTLTRTNGTQVETISNPDVSLIHQTLMETSREVQEEGWTFNKEFSYPFAPNDQGEIIWPNNVLQMDLSNDPRFMGYREKDTVKRQGKLYDRMNHTFTWDKTVYCDVLWFFEWEKLPKPIQDYITCRAAAIASSRLVGEPSQYKFLQQKEEYARALAMEYECNQGDYTIFGSSNGTGSYISYQPFDALRR